MLCSSLAMLVAAEIQNSQGAFIENSITLRKGLPICRNVKQDFALVLRVSCYSVLGAFVEHSIGHAVIGNIGMRGVWD